jgi:hypothetical protein
MISTIKVECDLKTLMAVVNATNNPDVAIQMLNGTYEEPFIAGEKIGKWDTKKYSTLTYNNGVEETVEMEERIPIIYTFVSYNPFTDTVTYKRNDGWKRTEGMSLEGWESLEDPYQLAV